MQTPTADRFTVRSTPKVETLDAKRNSLEGKSSVFLAILKCTSVFLMVVVLLITVSVSKFAFLSVGLQLSPNATYKTCTSSKLYLCRGPASFIVLTLMIMIPQALCFLRAVWMSGFRNSEPWPSTVATIWGIISSVFEVAGLCLFTFGVAVNELNPSRTVLFMNGIFLVPVIWQFLKHIRNIVGKDQPGPGDDTGYISYHTFSDMQFLDEHRRPGPKWYHIVISVLAACCGVGGIALFLIKGGSSRKEMVSLPLSLIFLSIAWCPKIKKLQIRTPERSETVDTADLYQSEDQERYEWEKIRVKTAREKSTIITSSLKLLLTPFIAVLCVYLLTEIDVKSLGHGFKALTISHDLQMALVAHFVSGFIANIVGWLGCTVGVQRLCFAFPLTVATPVCMLLLQVIKSGSVCSFLTFPDCNGYKHELVVTLSLAALFWLSQILSTTIYVWRTQDFLMAREEMLFWLPVYDGIFVEQGLVLNRRNNFTDEYYINYNQLVKKSVIYICTTMYHEADFEMEQLLHSIAGIDKARQEAQRQFESHIFLDDGVVGGSVKKYGLQLLSLLEITLNVSVEHAMKLATPYGLQMKWRLPGGMPFIIHFKDNLKVKNKKRWSQVMYMSYVLDFKEEKGMDDLTYILTTDADVKFTPNDVIALMDLMSRNPTVGAVCGRTHPIGSGPLVWYQIFDYAVGHWLLKVAEHVFGTVLCSPGCFSVYRARALRDVLPLYSSGTDCAMDFLTKDMGEDRWLCTLMIEAGWRLDFCAAAENFTYCPDNFNEFFKQRRRWTPSTLANQILLISESKKIRSNNDLISLPFIVYEVITMISSIIGPSTVILVIAGGLQYAYPTTMNLYAMLVVMMIIASLFTFICLKASDDVQLMAAKIFTFLFSVIMAITIVGILLQTSHDVANLIQRVHYTNQHQHQHHNSSTTNDLLHVMKFGNGSRPTILPPHSTAAPPKMETLYLLPTTWYLFAMVGLFIVTALIHGFEFVALVHGLWYLLCLPSGYLLLTIYSVANLTDRSWGTREDKVSGPKNEGVDLGVSVKEYLKYICWCCVPPGLRPGDEENKKDGRQGEIITPHYQPAIEPYYTETRSEVDSEQELTDESPTESEDTEQLVSPSNKETADQETSETDFVPEHTRLATALPDPPLKSALKKPGVGKRQITVDVIDPDHVAQRPVFRFPGQQQVQFSSNLPKMHAALSVEEWLVGPHRQFIQNFIDHGYDNVSFVTGMKEKDLIDIGISNRGFRKKILFEIQCLPPDEIAEDVPDDVEEWLINLGLEEYWSAFQRNSYTEPKDLADLKFIDRSVLQHTLEIEKEGHLRKLMRALRMLQYPTAAQRRIRKAKRDIDRVILRSLEKDNGDDGEEHMFWSELREMCLLPEQAAFGQSIALKEKLGDMRDNALLVLVISNILWLTFMVTVMSQGEKLALLGTSFASVAFLFVYTLVLVCQFISMVIHRLETWVHTIARAPFLPGKFHRNWSFKDDELPSEPSLEKLEEIRRRRLFRSGSNTTRSSNSSQQSLSTLPPIA